MFCPNCGTQIPDDAQFCSNCGESISIKAVPRQEMPQQAPPQPVPQQAPPQPVPQQVAPQQAPPQPVPQQVAPQQAPPQQPVPQQMVPQQPVQMQAPKKKSSKKWIGILVGLIVVAVGICVVVVLLNRSRDKDRGKPSSNQSEEVTESNSEQNTSRQQEKTEQTTQEQATQEQATQESPSSDNLIANGDFSAGFDGWGLYLENGNADLTITSDEMLEVYVTNCGDFDWNVQVYYDGFDLEVGAEYELSFDVYADSDLTFVAKIQENGGDYEFFVSNHVTVSNGGGRVTIPFTVELNSSYEPRLALNVGNMQEYGDTSPSGGYTFTFDNFELRRTSN